MIVRPLCRNRDCRRIDHLELSETKVRSPSASEAREIISLRQRGIGPRSIATQMGFSQAIVKTVLLVANLGVKKGKARRPTKKGGE
jgi:hypothetical protein